VVRQVLTDEELLARFVVRARRIEAHSLLKQEIFTQFLTGSMNMHLSVDGLATIRHPLPPDEEVFESLAARVRPLAVESEPIFHTTVLDALQRLLDASSSTTSEQRGELDELRKAWAYNTLSQDVQAYALRSYDAGGANTTDQVSDATLAAGWLYADLVHADAHHWKKKALAFSLNERYLAAVGVFSRLAALAVITLRLIKRLQDEGIAAVEQRAWEQSVVVDATEIVHEGIVYTAAPDLPMPPNLPGPLAQPGEDWTRLTITEHMRTNPANHIRVELADAEDAITAAYDAAVIHRELDADNARWRVLVAGSVIFDISLRIDADSVTALPGDLSVVGSAWRTKLAAHTFLLAMHQARTMTFRVQGKVFLTHEVEPVTPRMLAELRTVVALQDDLVALEALTGQEIGAPPELVSVWDRVRLRQIRMLWEGRAVQWDRALPPLASPEGIRPGVVRIEPAVLTIGDARIGTPEIVVWHPDVVWHEQEPASEAGSGARMFTGVIPTGTRFLAWAPARRPSTEELPLEGEWWDLPGLDQDAVPF
jgi:hypothetical protein